MTKISRTDIQKSISRQVLKSNLIMFAIAAVWLYFCAASALCAELVPMGIITGGPKGTYYQFGLNLQELVKRDGIAMRVDISRGSVENIYAVYKRPRTQLGIVQSDVLAFVAKVDTNPELKRIAKKIQLVYPLYNEEIHLLGRKDLLGFDDLSGKRVAIGAEGSGNYLTARLLFEVSGIDPAEMLTMGLDEALTQLKEGKIDAMFYIAGYPVKMFTENVTAGDNLHLVPILNAHVLEYYPESEIPAGTYLWQDQAVSTAAVKAVLISYNFRNYHCDTVGRVAQFIHENMNWLISNGHPKWKSVDLEYPLKGWKQYDCVQKYLAAGRPETQRSQSGDVNPVLNAIKDMLAK